MLITAMLAAMPPASHPQNLALQWGSMSTSGKAGDDRTLEPEEEPELSLTQVSGVSAADSSAFTLGPPPAVMDSRAS